MREILFRAKKKDNKEWVEGGYFLEPYTNKVFIIQWNSTGLGFNEFIEVIPETICQYTGEDDKANNKVFEYSIIKHISENVFGVVKFGEYQSAFDSEQTKHIGFYIDWCDKKRCKYWRKDLGYWLSVVTVIVGNIFDNPELLEGSDE